MAKYLSNRQKNLKVGISSYTESNTVLEVTGKVGIGTTNASTNLDVNGGLRVRGSLYDNNNNPGSLSYVPVADSSGGWSWQPVTSAGAGTLNGIIIQEEGGTVGTAGSITTLDFRGSNIVATATTGGVIATVTVSDTPSFLSLDVTGHSELDGVNVSGFLTATNASFSGNVSIAGTLTYEDVTNVDAIGIITARSGINIGYPSIASTIFSNGDAIFSGTVTAASFSGNIASANYAVSAGVASYSDVAGIATYATSAGIATYATSAGIATYATSAGIATYADVAGIATYATSAGIATYATSAGVSTDVIGGIASVTSLNVSGVTTLGTVEISAGVVTATSFSGSGVNLTGVVTSIIAGTGVSVTQSAGIVTITSTSQTVGLGTTGPAPNDILTLTPAFDGITSSFSIQHNGNPYYPLNEQQLIVSLGGVIQNPGVAYTVSGPTLYFVSAPNASTDYFIIGINAQTTGINKKSFSLTGVQTNFTLPGGYNLGYVDVYLNGARLVETLDFTATDGSTVGLTSAAQNGDVVDIIGFNGASLSLPSGDLEVFGNLSVTGITTLANVISTGIITASGFIGNLTGNASSATYATSAGIATYATVAGVATYATSAGIATYATSAGIATYSTTAGISTNVIGGIASVTSLDVSGISTLGTVQISSGIVTATSGIVTYYGDGSKLSNVISGVGIQSSGTVIGYGLTTLNFIGAGNTFAVNGTTIDISISSGAGGTWATYNAGIATNKSVGINTSTLDDANLTGVGNSLQGLYISNGMIIVDNVLSGNHYIGTNFNGLMAGPVTITGTLTIDGNYVVV